MKSGNLNFLEPSGPLQASDGTVYLYIDTHTNIHTYKVLKNTHTHTHTHTHIYIYIYKHTHTQTCMNVLANYHQDSKLGTDL